MAADNETYGRSRARVGHEDCPSYCDYADTLLQRNLRRLGVPDLVPGETGHTGAHLSPPLLRWYIQLN